MTFYVKSKSKTKTAPRTGNRYFGRYVYVALPKYDSVKAERIFLLFGRKAGKNDVVAFNSAAAAKKAGWVVVS